MSETARFAKGFLKIELAVSEPSKMKCNYHKLFYIKKCKNEQFFGGTLITSVFKYDPVISIRLRRGN